MLGLFRRFFVGNSNHARLKQDLVQAVDQGLDLASAIAAHENWKIRLDAYLAGASREDLRPEVICFDDRCDLGRWIHSTGKAKLSHMPAFNRLVEDHKTFHYAASNVVSLMQGGKREAAEKMLAGAYEEASSRVLFTLNQMRFLTAPSPLGATPPGKH
jgi:hypothetical protein